MDTRFTAWLNRRVPLGGISHMTDTTAGSRRFEIGRVISGTFGVIGRNFVPFALMALLLGGLPNLLMGLFQLRFAGGAATFELGWVGGSILGALAMLAATFVLQAAIVHATVADLNGRRVVLGDSLRAGLGHCLPLIGLAILTGLGVAIGLMLLIVPGLILMVAWSASVPAKVVEKIGVLTPSPAAATSPAAGAGRSSAYSCSTPSPRRSSTP
jgi:hypothetical protein